VSGRRLEKVRATISFAHATLVLRTSARKKCSLVAIATAYFGVMMQNLPQAQNASEPTVKRRFNMFALSKKLRFATVGTLVVLGGYGLPAFANDLTEVLGPVGPNDPIITTVGRKGVLAFYEADGSHCGMHVVMWDRDDESGDSAAGFRVTLDPRQVVHIDTAQNRTLGLQCGSAADTLAIVDTGKMYTAGADE